MTTMSSHNIEAHEMGRALAEFVIRRDGLPRDQAHRINLVVNCEIMKIGDGPLFTVHLVSIPLSGGGES